VNICRSCGARVLWVRTATGKPMPVDPRPNPSGNIRLRGNPDVLGQEDLRHLPAGSPLYLSHFVTCPQAGQHRRRHA
jgi:hypothetical protein